METIIIEYNPKNELAQSVIGLIKKISSIKIISDSSNEITNKKTLEAINDVENGKVYHAKNTEDLFKQILSD